MKKFIKENKLVSGIIAILFSSVITYNVLWGVWVTNQIFCQDKAIASHSAVQKEEEKSVKDSVKILSEDVKEVKKDLNKLDEKISDNNEKMLKILIDIKKGK